MESEKVNKVCSYKIMPMIPDEKHLIIEFLKEFFFQREPLVVCLNFSKDVKSLEKLQEYAFKNLDNGELINIYYVINSLYLLVY